MSELRIDDDVTRKERITITVDGELIQAFDGESVAAVLHAAGIRWGRRSVKRREARGYYCGMGVCWECTLSVDGRSGVRACVTTVCSGMQLVTER